MLPNRRLQQCLRTSAAAGYVCPVYDAAQTFATTPIPRADNSTICARGHRYCWPRELRTKNVNPAAGLNATSARTAAVPATSGIIT